MDIRPIEAVLTEDLNKKLKGSFLQNNPSGYTDKCAKGVVLLQYKAISPDREEKEHFFEFSGYPMDTYYRYIDLDERPQDFYQRPTNLLQVKEPNPPIEISSLSNELCIFIKDLTLFEKSFTPHALFVGKETEYPIAQLTYNEVDKKEIYYWLQQIQNPSKVNKCGFLDDLNIIEKEHKIVSSIFVDTSNSVDSESLRLIEKFENANDVKDYTDLAERFFDLCAKDDKASFSRLRSLFYATEEDQKKACILQLLGELFDNDALPLFVRVIKEFFQSENCEKPNLTQIAAITYVRLLKLPDNNKVQIKENLVEWVVGCAEKYIDKQFDEKQFLIGGAILTVRALGNVANSYQFVVKCLNYKDEGIVRLALEAIRSIWLANINDSREQAEAYKTKLCNEFQNLLEVHQFNPSLIEKILLTMEVVEPTLLSTILPMHLASAINNRFSGLTTTIVSILKKLPRKLRKEVVVAFLKDPLVSKETMSKLLLLTLAEY